MSLSFETDSNKISEVYESELKAFPYNVFLK